MHRVLFILRQHGGTNPSERPHRNVIRKRRIGDNRVEQPVGQVGQFLVQPAPHLFGVSAGLEQTGTYAFEFRRLGQAFAVPVDQLEVVEPLGHVSIQRFIASLHPAAYHHAAVGAGQGHDVISCTERFRTQALIQGIVEFVGSPQRGRFRLLPVLESCFHPIATRVLQKDNRVVLLRNIGRIPMYQLCSSQNRRFSDQFLQRGVNGGHGFLGHRGIFTFLEAKGLKRGFVITEKSVSCRMTSHAGQAGYLRHRFHSGR